MKILKTAYKAPAARLVRLRAEGMLATSHAVDTGTDVDESDKSDAMRLPNSKLWEGMGDQ